MLAPALVIAFAFGDLLPAAPAQAAGVIYVVPGGTGDGVYVVRLAAGAIADKAGNVAPTTELGSFTVALRERVWLPLIAGAAPKRGLGQSLPPGF
jgi:hypothetical protein